MTIQKLFSKKLSIYKQSFYYATTALIGYTELGNRAILANQLKTYYILGYKTSNRNHADEKNVINSL